MYYLSVRVCDFGDKSLFFIVVVKVILIDVNDNVFKFVFENYDIKI